MAIDKPVRDASDRCNIAQSDYFSAFGARPDVYRALLAVQRSGTARTDADKKLLEIYLVMLRNHRDFLPCLLFIFFFLNEVKIQVMCSIIINQQL